MTVWKPEPHLILDTERHGEEFMYACGSHRYILSVFECIGPHPPMRRVRPGELIQPLIQRGV